jgi:intracellular multiplication protein IcmO
VESRYHHIEGTKEIRARSSIVDVKTGLQKFMEWVCWPRNFSKLMIGCAVVACAVPALLPLISIVTFFFAIQYEGQKRFMPIRYPAWFQAKDPRQLDAKDRPRQGEGILYMGVVDASDPYWRNMQVFLSADDLKRHMLILGTTGSGKSETLKGITLNILCWASGFFLSDAKADNKLPTDGYSQVRLLGRDYDFLILNYMLGGLSPAEISNMRERLSNGLQPATSADADTLVQMVSNILVKAGGDSKSWQERGLNLFRGIARALAHKRDMGELDISMELLRDNLALEKIEDLYMEGHLAAEANGGIWPTPYLGVKSYLEVGLPGFKREILFRKKEQPTPEMQAADSLARMAAGNPIGFAPQQQQKEAAKGQSNDTFNQHGYRADQMYPALSLLIDTYGHIFKRKFPEIDMDDVVVNNRICFSLIPSLEKGSQEQESLGKLNLALLRVMMAKALGNSIEGNVEFNVDAKITNADVPFGLLLDEFAYQFADGIALTTAQVRSLNFFLLALAQDLEKLTEGDRVAEAGAMMANQASKFFMKIIGSDKTHDLAAKTLGEAEVAVVGEYEQSETLLGGIRKRTSYRIEKRPRVSRQVLENFASGFATFFYADRAHIFRTFYVSDRATGVPRVKFPRINRFMQISIDKFHNAQLTHSVLLEPSEDKAQIDHLKKMFSNGQSPALSGYSESDIIESLKAAAAGMMQASPIERGIVLYQAGIAGLKRLQAANGVLPHIGPVKGSGSSGGPKERPQDLSTMPTGRDLARAEAQALEAAQLQQTRPLDVDAQLAEYDPIAEMAGLDSAVVRKSKTEVFVDDSLEPFDALATDSVAPEGGAEETVRQQAAARPVDADEDTEVLTPAAMGDDFEIPARAPVELSDLAEQQLARVTSLSNTVVPDSAVDLLGPQVVGLKDNSINGIEVVARAMGASPEQAHNDALAAQRGVATAYTPPPPAGGDPTETDVDQLFSVVIEHMEENSGGTAR